MLQQWFIRHLLVNQRIGFAVSFTWWNVGPVIFLCVPVRMSLESWPVDEWDWLHFLDPFFLEM